MKVFKSIMLYLLLIIGVALAAVLICCVIMICSPRTVVFGYKYVSFKERITEDPIELGAVSAVSVTSNRMDIIIVPNTESDEVLISYSQGMSGFVKADAPDLKVEITASKTMEFNSGDSSYGAGTSYNTFCVTTKPIILFSASLTAALAAATDASVAETDAFIASMDASIDLIAAPATASWRTASS